MKLLKVVVALILGAVWTMFAYSMGALGSAVAGVAATIFVVMMVVLDKDTNDWKGGDKE